MRLVEIADGVCINPEKVIAVKLESKLGEYKDAEGRPQIRELHDEKEVWVYMQALMHIVKEKSELSWPATINLLSYYPQFLESKG
jgi:hypothetical protein